MIGMLVGFTFMLMLPARTFWLALIISVVVAALVLVTIERFIYRQIMKVSSMYLFICTIRHGDLST